MSELLDVEELEMVRVQAERSWSRGVFLDA